MEKLSGVEELIERMTKAFDERKWQKFHSPKNLTMTLGSEVGELLDEFRWLTEEESYHLSGQKKQDVMDEIGDVFLVVTHLADKLGIDPVEAALKKLTKVEKKYPVDLCQGKIDKYSSYEG